MSLNWDATKLSKGSKAHLNNLIIDDKKIDGLISNFAWVLMGIDVREVTETNLDEIYLRNKVADRVFGATMLTGYKLRMEDLKHLVGYSTNVTTKTRAQFLRKMAQVVESQAKDEVYNEKRAEREKATVAA